MFTSFVSALIGILLYLDKPSTFFISDFVELILLSNSTFEAFTLLFKVVVPSFSFTVPLYKSLDPVFNLAKPLVKLFRPSCNGVNEAIDLLVAVSLALVATCFATVSLTLLAV